MELKDRITKYIIKNAPVLMTDLVRVATSKGYTESETLSVLTGIDRDKRIKVTTKGDDIVYGLASAKVSTVPTHVTWLTANYPWPPPEWTEAFPEIDMSHIFMTRDEAKEYKAQASGRPVFMQNKYARQN